MNDLQEKLAKRWPDLFQKSCDFECSIGDGWYDIIDVLCGFISHRVESAKRRLNYALEHPEAKFNEPIVDLEKEVADAIEELPAIQQVKEKFGTLRFYVSSSTLEVSNYIEFAEAMSSRTCEVCGNPGFSRTGRWIKVLCNKHSKEQDGSENDTVTEIVSGKPVKLSDE
jgi:hypothetical protein